MRKNILSGVTLMLLAGMVSTTWSGETGALGVVDGRLAACPTSPNCVSSQADPQDLRHYIAPLAYQGDRESAREKLVTLLEGQKRVSLVVRNDDYLRAEFRSLLFRFVDDVEFYLADEGRIDVRSASRLGYSDLGVNRKRIEKLRSEFE